MSSGILGTLFIQPKTQKKNTFWLFGFSTRSMSRSALDHPWKNGFFFKKNALKRLQNLGGGCLKKQRLNLTALCSFLSTTGKVQSRRKYSAGKKRLTWTPQWDPLHLRAWLRTPEPGTRPAAPPSCCRLSAPQMGPAKLFRYVAEVSQK